MTYPDDYQVNIEEWPVNEKGFHVVPDEIMERFYKQLPTGTINESGTYRAFNGGKLYQIGSTPEKDGDICSKGGKVWQATLHQRRTMAEDLRDLLARPASDTVRTAAGIEQGSNQAAILAAALREAGKGNVRAMEYIRDTIGEAPVKQAEITAQVTEGDKELLRKVQQRLGIE